MFFVPLKGGGAGTLPVALRLAVPAILLALGGVGLVPWLMSVGFAFCAIGDTMGVLGSFEGQMGGFALAHVCFIGWMAGSFLRKRKGMRNGFSLYIILTLVCLVPLVIAVVRIIPSIGDGVIRMGCTIYSLLLTGTLWASWMRFASLQSRPQRKGALLGALGATLFFISDFVLAWNKFVERVPDSRIIIMTTYYAALLLLFVGTLKVSVLLCKSPDSKALRAEK